MCIRYHAWLEFGHHEFYFRDWLKKIILPRNLFLPFNHFCNAYWQTLKVYLAKKINKSTTTTTTNEKSTFQIAFDWDFSNFKHPMANYFEQVWWGFN